MHTEPPAATHTPTLPATHTHTHTASPNYTHMHTQPPAAIHTPTHTASASYTHPHTQPPPAAHTEPPAATHTQPVPAENSLRGWGRRKRGQGSLFGKGEGVRWSLGHLVPSVVLAHLIRPPRDGTAFKPTDPVRRLRGPCQLWDCPLMGECPPEPRPPALESPEPC